MSLPLQIPYYASHVPCALPSKTEIKAASLIGHDYQTQKVARVGVHFVVKYGAQVSAIEGENLIYIRQTTSIPVPNVYAIYKDSDEDCDRTSIIKEYVPGETLALIWSTLNDAQKETIAGVLRGYFTELRALPSPKYSTSIGKRHLLESMFWTPEGLRSISGPFDTEAELNEAGILQSSRTPTSNVKNMMVDVDSDNGVRVTLVDWEKSGWLPSYWEYSMAMLSYLFRDDWSGWLDKILDPFYAEYPYLQTLHFELWS